MSERLFSAEPHFPNARTERGPKNCGDEIRKLVEKASVNHSQQNDETL